MAFKNIVVSAESTGRDKSNLAERIDEEVNKLLKLEKAELTDMHVDADFAHGAYGKALVTVFYSIEKKK